MFRSLLLSAVLLAATPLAAQEFTPQDLVSYAQSEEEALLRERERLLAAEAALAEPLWLRRSDGQVDVVDGGPIYDRASFVIEMAVSMRAEAEIDSLEAAAGFEMPAFLRDITQQVAEAVAATDTPDQASIVSRARNRLIDAYRTASQATRRETLVGIDQRLTWVREVFEEAQQAREARAFPAIYSVFTSSYGDIHWDEGYYGDPNKTLAVSDIREDRAHAVWVVEGRWARVDDPDRVGGFEFWFSSACSFSGWWWYDNDRPDVESRSPNWTGECAGG